MSFTISCNVCMRSKTRLLNICNGNKFKNLFELVDLLSGPQLKLDQSNVWICGRCHLILQKILEFQTQLQKTQKQIALFLAQRNAGPSKSRLAKKQTSSQLKEHSDGEDSDVMDVGDDEDDEVSDVEAVAEIKEIDKSEDTRNDTDKHENTDKVKEDDDDDAIIEDNSEIEDCHDANVVDDSYDDDDDGDDDDDLDYEPEQPKKKPAIKPDPKTIAQSVVVAPEEVYIKKECSSFIFPNEEVLPVIEDIKKRYLSADKCCLCDYNSETRQSLISHMKDTHEDISHNWCTICNTMIADGDNTHNCKDDLVCTFCKLPCMDPLRLVDHLQFHCKDLDSTNKKVDSIKPTPRNPAQESTTITRRRYMCRRCKTVYTDEALMRTHKCAQVQNAKKIARTCGYCGRNFSNADRFKAHLSTHTGEPRFKCKYCGKVMTQKFMLVQHERIHTGEKPHVCQFCGKAFTQSSTLLTHVKIHNGRSIPCSMCDKLFCRDVDLRLHVKRAHLGEKPEKTLLCNACGYATDNRYSLNRHMETHSEERKYECKQCGKSFKQKAILQKHVLTHSDAKPHKCPVCPYRCTLKSNLKQHARKHANEAARSAAKNGGQLFPCDHCSRSFGTDELLLEHIRSTHAKLD